MRMHIGRNVAALGLAVVVIGGAAGTALAASDGSSATSNTASVTAVDASAQSSTAKLTYAQLAAKLGVSTKALLDAIGDFKNLVVSIPGKKTAADLKSILVKTLVPELHISGSAAVWAADEILGGYVSN